MTLIAFTEAVKLFQKDKYESCWLLVSRVKGEDEENMELRKLDQKIMEEKSKKRKRGGPTIAIANKSRPSS